MRKYSYIFASADLNKLQTKRFQNVYIPSSVSSRLFQCSYPITLLSFAEYLQKAIKLCQTNFFVLSLKSDLNPKFNWFHDHAFLCSNVYLIFLNHKLHFFTPALTLSRCVTFLFPELLGTISSWNSGNWRLHFCVDHYSWLGKGPIK